MTSISTWFFTYKIGFPGIKKLVFPELLDEVTKELITIGVQYPKLVKIGLISMVSFSGAAGDATNSLPWYLIFSNWTASKPLYSIFLRLDSLAILILLYSDVVFLFSGFIFL